MVRRYLTQNPNQTKKLGDISAKEILKNGIKSRGFILGLEGDLGGGKTTFLQGFAKGLGIKEKITSPTFVIMKKFEIRDSKFGNFYHFDCYRLGKPKEILALGFKKIIANHQNIVAIEWAGKIKKLLPEETIWLKFQFINNRKRKISINP